MSLLLLFRSIPLPEEGTGGGGSGFNWAADPLRKAEVHILSRANLRSGPAKTSASASVSYPAKKAISAEEIRATTALEAAPGSLTVAAVVDFTEYNARMRAIIISLPD